MAPAQTASEGRGPCRSARSSQHCRRNASDDFPVGEVAGHSHYGEEIRVIPLHLYTNNRVGVVAGPKLVKIAQSPIIHSPATARTQHQFCAGKSFYGLIHRRVERANVINPEMRLPLGRKPGRARLRKITIAVPFGKGYPRHAEKFTQSEAWPRLACIWPGWNGRAAEPYAQLTAPRVLLVLGLQRKSRGFSLVDANIGH